MKKWCIYSKSRIIMLQNDILLALPNIFDENWQRYEPENNTIGRPTVLNAPAILASTFVVKINYSGFFKEKIYKKCISATLFHAGLPMTF
jgi:hypothetical protein